MLKKKKQNYFNQKNINFSNKNYLKDHKYYNVE